MRLGQVLWLGVGLGLCLVEGFQTAHLGAHKARMRQTARFVDGQMHPVSLLQFSTSTTRQVAPMPTDRSMQHPVMEKPQVVSEPSSSSSEPSNLVEMATRVLKEEPMAIAPAPAGPARAAAAAASSVSELGASFAELGDDESTNSLKQALNDIKNEILEKSRQVFTQSICQMRQFLNCLFMRPCSSFCARFVGLRAQKLTHMLSCCCF